MNLDEATALAELASDPELSAKVLARTTTVQAWQVARTLLQEVKRLQRKEIGTPIAELMDAEVDRVVGSAPALKHADFHIGLEFTTAKPARWRCTDVGTRTIAAIELTVDDPNWWAYKGPTYGTAEIVFDEDDFPGCYRVIE